LMGDKNRRNGFIRNRLRSNKQYKKNRKNVTMSDRVHKNVELKTEDSGGKTKLYKRGSQGNKGGEGGGEKSWVFVPARKKGLQ